MSAYFEIAYAAASNRLCLFTGTGFSKAVSSNTAPSWQRLLEDICDTLPEPAKIKSALFLPSGQNPLPLEEAAQIIDIELRKKNRCIHEQIAESIAAIKLAGNNEAIADFINENIFEVVTTNYDKLFEYLSANTTCQAISPGLPVPRSPANIRVYHIHGSVDSPSNMIVTSDDYFRFLNGDSYFSRKLSTILHENTVVILGYSLGDTNLKTILSDYKGFSRTNMIGSSIFLISRSQVAQYIKDYYAHSFGIRVLDQLEIHTFFEEINRSLADARKCAKTSRSNIKKVLHEEYSYTDNFLLMESAFFEIVASISAIGLSINSKPVVDLLGKIIDKKIGFTQVIGAWEQYAHLAKWLIYLGSILELKGTSVQNVFLTATLRSMTTMSRRQLLGYSWHAHRAWAAGWPNLIASNRALIRQHVEANTTWPDAKEIVANA